jgi:type III pantothenate kinase
MIALVDIGNTRVKWAVADGTRFTAVGAVTHVDGQGAAVDALMTALPKGVDRVLIANVAGAALAQRLTDALHARRGIRAEFVAARAKGYGIRCAYADPARLGVDRWVAMIAARRLVAGDFCVIQAGTAVTFDAVDAEGRHLGGLIFAGPRLLADALNRNTGRIGPTQPARAPLAGLELLGRSTEVAVAHAAMLSLAAGLDRAVTVVGAALGQPPAVLLTGGGAHSLGPWLETDVRTSADLVLAGLAYMAEQGG